MQSVSVRAIALLSAGLAQPVYCPLGAGGRAPAPKAGDRRKKRKEQKIARRNNRNR